MNGLRLAFVTRRFWPLVGENELTIASLAAELHHRGHRPVFVTPKYSKHWPGEVCVREVAVTRLPFPPPKAWGSVRFSFALSRWIHQRLDEFDAVIVSGAPEDALTVLGAVKGTTVPVLMQSPAGLPSSEATPRMFSDSLLRRLSACDAWVALDAGNQHPSDTPQWFPAEKQLRIPLGVQLSSLRSFESRMAARQALGEINHDLAVSPDASVAICLAPLHRDFQLDQLARAWRAVQSRWSDARLWLIGDGPSRGELFELLGDLELKYQMVLPGTFDDWDVLLQAADFLVQPSLSATLTPAILQAMGTGLPVLTFGGHPGFAHRFPVPQADSSLPLNHIAVSRENPQPLAAALVHMFEHPSNYIRLGERARRFVEANHQVSTMVDHYEQAILRIVDSRQTTVNRSGRK